MLIYNAVIALSKYKLIMSDLDNTLLPIITQERFVEIWFRDAGQKFAACGLDAQRALEGVNEGIRAMIFNESGRKNIDVFYETAQRVSGYGEAVISPVMFDYYTTTFANVRAITRPNPYAVQIAGLMRSKAPIAGIATMPVFPIEAARMRMGWIGLTEDMFDFVTSAANSSYCKPNPLYYQEILDRCGIRPEEALMVGNDVREDMQPCKALGIDTFLVTEYIITHDLPYDGYRQGGYPELVAFLKSL